MPTRTMSYLFYYPCLGISKIDGGRLIDHLKNDGPFVLSRDFTEKKIKHINYTSTFKILL